MTRVTASYYLTCHRCGRDFVSSSRHPIHTYVDAWYDSPYEAATRPSSYPWHTACLSEWRVKQGQDPIRPPQPQIRSLTVPPGWFLEEGTPETYARHARMHNQWLYEGFGMKVPEEMRL